MAIVTQATRFALLKIDDDVSSEDESKTDAKANSKKQQQTSSKKKKSRKNKKVNSEREQLKNLAFGGDGKRSGGSQVQGQPVGNGHHPAALSKGEASDKQWDEWRKMDTDQAAESYEKDLQQALLLSKLEHEENKGDGNKPGTSTRPDSRDSKHRKKGKKKEKPQAMSLDQFNQSKPTKEPSQNPPDPTYEFLPPPVKPNTTLPPHADPDSKFFLKVEEDAHKIIHKEHVQEEYRKQFAVEGAVVSQLRTELENRLQEIKQLQKENKGLTEIMFLFQEELKQVKKRNQQLCHILSQGEMKDKAAVQLEMEEMEVSHRELTEEVTQLTEELEKERSKNGTLKAENDKLRGGKHR